MDAFKLKVLHALTSIAANGPTLPYCGICGNVIDAVLDIDRSPSVVYEILEPLIIKWPEYAGNWAYPVENSLIVYTRNIRMWDVNTPFGAKRYRLLAFMIHELSKEYYDTRM